LKAGFDFARGEVIISMDGDLQHDPEEIPAFSKKSRKAMTWSAGGATRGAIIGCCGKYLAALRTG